MVPPNSCLRKFFRVKQFGPLRILRFPTPDLHINFNVPFASSTNCSTWNNLNWRVLIPPRNGMPKQIANRPLEGDRFGRLSSALPHPRRASSLPKSAPCAYPFTNFTAFPLEIFASRSSARCRCPRRVLSSYGVRFACTPFDPTAPIHGLGATWRGLRQGAANNIAGNRIGQRSTGTL